MEDNVEWGRVLQKLEHLEEKVDLIQSEFTTLKNSMNKGWGIVIGIAGTTGLFASDIIDSFKRFMGWL